MNYQNHAAHGHAGPNHPLLARHAVAKPLSGKTAPVAPALIPTLELQRLVAGMVD
ncbi:hypothetical protein HT136_08780 [Novosphingobium profundi]|uniref:hypothetical protein n=1 Tax=Novosphingobium profundi TaxID=1774954 RepID=UPI001BD9202F|nr:hypothetical protein [Novosphingobium profundi]MBT0668464.1 hypothetical protein [Novosphingobium profundi]